MIELAITILLYLIKSLGEGPPTEDGYIEPSVPREQVRQDPYPLPSEFIWSVIDLQDDAQVGQKYLNSHYRMLMIPQIKEVYDLLSLNYVEDDRASFRFQYTAKFLKC